MRRIRCPKCKKVYMLGYNGVAAGCDTCMGVQRDRSGDAWLPGETEHTYQSVSDGMISGVKREDAELRGER